jgi:beta-lactamase regulating signal transducer with metallopeptidase domain
MSLLPFAVHAARASLLLGLGLLAMRLMRRASASARLWVVALTLASVLVLPVIEALAPHWRLAPAWMGAAIPLSGHAPFAEPLVGAAPASPLGAVSASTTNATVLGSFSWAGAAALVWAVGALVVFARAAVSMLRARRLVRRSRPIEAPSRAPVRFSEELDAPVVAGVFAPVVLVPTMAERWSRERWRVVLLHEQAHIDQKDGIVQLVAHLASAVHWFNPLVWVAARRLRTERELAADEAVLRAGVRATSYAEHLLALAVGTQPAAEAMGMAESPLVARMRAILDPRFHPRFSGLARLVTGLVAASMIALVACIEAQQPSSEGTAPMARVAPDPKGRLQTIADEEIARARTEWAATSAVAIVLDPATGAVLALAGDREAADRASAPGSTLKAFTFAAALEEKTIRPTDRVDCENGAHAYGTRTLHDWGSYGLLDLPEVLAVSSNVGAAKVGETLGADRAARWLRRFHFGEPPGRLPDSVDPSTFEGAVVVIGEGMSASPMQIAAGYAALAAGGVYRAPGGAPSGGERVISTETARTIVGLLTEVVEGAHGTGGAARIPGVRVAGKTGTADRPAAPGDAAEQVYASFVGMAPADAPRFVVLVGLETARDGASGGTVAAPVFARIAARALAL